MSLVYYFFGTQCWCVALSTYKSQKFRFGGGDLPLRDEFPRAIFFYKITGGSPRSAPHAKFHHRGFRNVGLSPPKSSNMDVLV